MIRNTAHRCTFLQSAVLAGQGQFKFSGRSFCILKKQFVKIPEPEQQQTIGVLVMNPQILLHHR